MNPQRLTLDERNVLERQPGTILPDHLGRAHWQLVRDGVAKDHRFYRHGRPRHLLRLTDQGAELRKAITRGFGEPENGWGILLMELNGPDCWWGPDGKSYATDISYAGLYTKDRAVRQNGCGRCGMGRDMAVPPARMRELLDDEIQKTRARLDRLIALRDQIPEQA